MLSWVLANLLVIHKCTSKLSNVPINFSSTFDASKALSETPKQITTHQCKVGCTHFDSCGPRHSWIVGYEEDLSLLTSEHPRIRFRGRRHIFKLCDPFCLVQIGLFSPLQCTFSCIYTLYSLHTVKRIFQPYLTIKLKGTICISVGAWGPDYELT